MVGTSKLDTKQVFEIKARLAMGEPCAKIARDFHVCRGAVSKIKNNHNWKHI
jgi:hypothetical protein